LPLSGSTRSWSIGSGDPETATRRTSGCGNVFKLTPPATPGGAWPPSVLHGFDGNDGADPRAGLIFDDSGSLYGTTRVGGVYGFGTVFELSGVTLPVRPAARAAIA
jgi:uncharacterized repeat protein (TIGR03803 family)